MKYCCCGSRGEHFEAASPSGFSLSSRPATFLIPLSLFLFFSFSRSTVAGRIPGPALCLPFSRCCSLCFLSLLFLNSEKIGLPFVALETCLLPFLVPFPQFNYRLPRPSIEHRRDSPSFFGAFVPRQQCIHIGLLTGH